MRFCSYSTPAIILVFACLSCKNESILTADYSTIEGETMGTTYHIIYDSKTDLKPAIDSLLIDFNNSVSTYIPTSTISKINQADSLFCFDLTEDLYFKTSFEEATRISELTQGNLEPTIMPLVNYWGFGYKERVQIPEINYPLLDSLKSYLGLEKLKTSQNGNQYCISKTNPNIQLDLSATAKGHGVDVVAEHLQNKGIQNYMVEIGGEIRTLGVNRSKQPWVIGINRPEKGAGLNEIELPIKISNLSMATSGNYRIFYEADSVSFAHIIDPFTGLARPTDILSATIIASNCLLADGLATACMVMGLEKASTFIQNQDSVEALFIYANETGDGFEYYYTSGFSSHLIQDK